MWKWLNYSSFINGVVLFLLSQLDSLLWISDSHYLSCYWNLKMLLSKMTCFIRSRKLLGSHSRSPSFLRGPGSPSLSVPCAGALHTVQRPLWQMPCHYSWEAAEPDPRPVAQQLRLLMSLYLNSLFSRNTSFLMGTICSRHPTPQI